MVVLCGKTNNSSIPTTCILENDVLINYPKQKTTISNNYFVSKTLLPGANSAVPPEILLHPSGKFLSFVDVIEGELMLLMKNVDVSKACAFDGIGNNIIKFCSEGIHSFFTKFINFSFTLGQYFSAWKMANVVPVFKKSKPQIKTNY